MEALNATVPCVRNKMSDKKRNEKRKRGGDAKERSAHRDWMITLWEKSWGPDWSPGSFISWFTGLADASTKPGLYNDEQYTNRVRYGIMQRETSADENQTRRNRLHWQIFIQVGARVADLLVNSAALALTVPE